MPLRGSGGVTEGHAGLRAEAVAAAGGEAKGFSLAMAASLAFIFRSFAALSGFWASDPLEGGAVEVVGVRVLGRESFTAVLDNSFPALFAERESEEISTAQDWLIAPRLEDKGGFTLLRADCETRGRGFVGAGVGLDVFFFMRTSSTAVPHSWP